MEKDPVCRMTVDEKISERAGLVVEHDGLKYFFCAKGCKERFESHPEKYLSGEQTDWVKG